jgi:hypothetical protein
MSLFLGLNQPFSLLKGNALFLYLQKLQEGLLPEEHPDTVTTSGLSVPA